MSGICIKSNHISKAAEAKEQKPRPSGILTWKQCDKRHECASIGVHVHPVQTLFILIICSFMLLTCSNSTRNIAARDCSHLVKD